MKKIKILIVFFIFPLFILEAQVLQYPAMNEYPAVQAAFIPSGAAEQEVECFMDVKPGGIGHESPTAWAMSPDGKIYIADDRKRRIAVYDLDGNYIKQFKSDKIYLGNITEIKIDGNGNIFWTDAIEGSLNKMDVKGELIYKIGRKNLRGFNGIFYTYEDYVFYYRINELKGFNPKGDIMPKEEINNLFLDINDEDADKGIKSYADIQKPLEKFFKKRNVIYKDEKLFLTTSANVYNELWNILSGNMEIQKIKSDYWAKSMKESDNRIGKAKVQRGAIITADDMEEYRKNAGSLIGYDSDGNLAFQGRNGITIIDTYGSVLDAFNCKDMERYSAFVAPGGDIYFINRAKDGITFYKVVRRW